MNEAKGGEKNKFAGQNGQKRRLRERIFINIRILYICTGVQQERKAKTTLFPTKKIQEKNL